MNDLSSRILYCDPSCVVVNKKPGEAVEGAGSEMKDLPKQLAAELPASPESKNDILEVPVAAHRLDVPVSGCVVFARTGTALRFLNTAFGASAHGRPVVEKNYWAVVEKSDAPPDSAVFPEGAFGDELVHWIQFDTRRNRSTAFDEPGPGRKKAILRCRLAGKGQNYLFLEIKSITGRHHQIRAQLERMDIHIKGDLKYGARRSEKNGGIRLHARSISFPNPADENGRIVIQADPPLQDNLWLAFP